MNSETLELVQRALSRLPSEALDGDAVNAGIAHLRTTALQAWEAASAEPTADNPAAILRAVAERLDLPPAVASRVLTDAGIIDGKVAADRDRPAFVAARARTAPDWSFQDTAHSRCLDSLAQDPNRKVGLVLPTGGGKTRVAMRIALSSLARSSRQDSTVLWVTHRTRLKTQAHRELQRAITKGTPDLPDDAVGLLGERVEFCMISGFKADWPTSVTRPNW